MNGSVLGMRRREIQRKFDEIVDFSGIEGFLDTPVKRYSSGMYVRLAFAVAAHLEPEVLIVDEVLAVGDAEFQRKCLGKMRDVAGHGRTILFVSHHLGSLSTICENGIVLREGSIGFVGTISASISHYLESISARSKLSVGERSDRGGTGAARIAALEIAPARRESTDEVLAGEEVIVSITLDRPHPQAACTFTIYNEQGVAVSSINSKAGLATGDSRSLYTFTCRMTPLLLLPGRYRINAAVVSGKECIDHVEGALEFRVIDGKYGEQPIHRSTHAMYYQPHTWQF
jgi:lipopolysaccharide transport system ATP-binding protein